MARQSLLLSLILFFSCASPHRRQAIVPSDIGSDQSSAIQSKKQELQGEIREVAAELYLAYQKLPDGSGTLMEVPEEEGEEQEHLLWDTKAYVNQFSQDEFTEQLVKEADPSYEQPLVEEVQGAESAALVHRSSGGGLGLAEGGFKMYWINWTPVNGGSKVSRGLYWFAGRNFLHTSILVIPQGAEIKFDEKGRMQIKQRGTVIPPTFYYSRMGRGNRDDLLTDAREYSMGVKRGHLIAEFFEKGELNQKQVEALERTQLDTFSRSPLFQAATKETWDRWETARWGASTELGEKYVESQIEGKLKKLPPEEFELKKIGDVLGTFLTTEPSKGYRLNLADYFFHKVGLAKIKKLLIERGVPVEFHEYLDSRQVRALITGTPDLNEIKGALKTALRETAAFKKWTQLKGTPVALGSLETLVYDEVTQKSFYLEFTVAQSDYSRSYASFSKNCTYDACGIVKGAGLFEGKVEPDLLPAKTTRKVYGPTVDQSRTRPLIQQAFVTKEGRVEIQESKTFSSQGKMRPAVAGLTIIAVGALLGGTSYAAVSYVTRDKGKLSLTEDDQDELVEENDVANQEIVDLLDRYGDLASQLTHVHLVEQFNAL
ncbi:MAG: hypothetical protein HYW48_09575 [Deltaproteobacteria bacterium]|nr:hypothetical protein [Deltaproteobacteria bacterium]